MKYSFKENKVFIIAEAGVNHNGNVIIAKKMIDAAKRAGVDAVKFQTFKAELFISKFAPKAPYQKKATGTAESQLEMVRKLELTKGAHIELMTHCKKSGLMFLSTPFDLESADVLKSLGLKIFKIPSGEITNLPLLKKIGGLKKKIIMSTGMSTLDEIKKAFDVVVKAGTRKENITLLHCNTEYPTPFEDVNLRAMLQLKDVFKVDVGYSDHTTGIEVSIAAVALGATVIEKHFTLDKNMHGPDHQASLEPKELSDMVKAIRHIEKALGSLDKKPSPSEIKNILIARKSIVAARDIQKGEIFTEKNLAVKRPATGLNPMLWDQVAGRKAKQFFGEDEPIAL